MAQTKTRSKPKPKATGLERANRKERARRASRKRRRVEQTENERDAEQTAGWPGDGRGDRQGRGPALATPPARRAAVGKAKVPLLAGGAALAGAAGGIALGAAVRRTVKRPQRSAKVIDSEDLAKAAKKVGDVGAQIGESRVEVRRARE